MAWLHQLQLAQPWYLLGALLIIPALWWARRSAGRVVFSSLRALPLGGASWRTRLAWLPDAMLTTAVLALVIALTGPRAGDETARIRREGIAVMMAVDVSGSMRALDLSAKNQELTRLDAVKQVFAQFVLGGDGLDGRTDDAIGLISFARYADTRSPLTLDHGNLIAAARGVELVTEPKEDGTAIGAGLELAVERLKDFPARSKVAVLLTDGESNIHDNGMDERTAIDDAVKAGVKVYTIGAGTTGLAPIRVDTGDGRTQLMQTEVSIDETLLREIADKTGGKYFRATDHKALEGIYAQIDKLERTTIDQEQFSHYHQYYGWFVAAAMALVVLAFALRGTILRRLP